MKNIFIILFISLYACINAQVVTLYNHQNALFDPQNDVSSINKIGDNIWVGEDLAINKFDGENWERFIYTDINSPWEYLWPSSFTEDSEGNVWCVGVAGIHKYDGENWFFYGDGTPGIEPGTDQFFSMVITEDDQMIAVGGNTVWSWIYNIDLATMTFTLFDRDAYPILDDIIQDVMINSEGEIILAAAEGGLIEFDGTSFTPHSAVINFEICGDDIGNYWTGGWSEDQNKGLYCYNSQFEEEKYFNTGNSFLPYPRVFRTAFNNYIENEIWFRASELVLEDGVIGVYNVDKDYFQVFDLESGMPGTRVTGFYFDEGEYWIVLENTGVAKIDLNESPYLGLEAGNIVFEVPVGSEQHLDLELLNIGGGTLNYELDFSNSASWVDADEVSGTFNGNSGNHQLTFDATGYSQPAELETELLVKSNGGHIRFNVTMKVVLNEGFNELENELNIYPNPVSDILFLESNTRISEINLYNLLGNLVLTHGNLVNQQIDLSGVEPGLYLLEVQYKHHIITRKIRVN